MLEKHGAGLKIMTNVLSGADTTSVVYCMLSPTHSKWRKNDLETKHSLHLQQFIYEQRV